MSEGADMTDDECDAISTSLGWREYPVFISDCRDLIRAGITAERARFLLLIDTLENAALDDDWSAFDAARAALSADL
jgi:hypothetical protein